MAKINISMPDALLRELDQRAAATNRSRSGLIQEAAASYLAGIDSEQARIARRDRIQRAYEKMRAVATRIPPGTEGTAIIRKFREMPEPWITGDYGDKY